MQLTQQQKSHLTQVLSLTGWTVSVITDCSEMFISCERGESSFTVVLTRLGGTMLNGRRLNDGEKLVVSATTAIPIVENTPRLTCRGKQ